MGKAEIPAAPIMGFTFLLQNRFSTLANSTPPAVSSRKASRPSHRIISVSQVTNSSARIWNATVSPSSSVMRLASSCWALWLRLSSTPHSRIRLPNIKNPMSSALLGAAAPASTVTRMGNKILVALDTLLGVYSMRILRSSAVVKRRITGGWTIGTSAM